MADIAAKSPIASGRTAASAGEADRGAWLTVGAAFAVAFALQAYLVFAKSINWDEFFHFHHIYELRSGIFSRALQVLYIRWFEWLFDLPLDPVDQLLIGRLAVLACMPVIAAAIFGIARRFGSPLAAALSALAYTTGGYVFLHGFAFRADPQATMLLMVALWLLVARRLAWATIGAIALLLALATMITVKSIFFAPAFAGLCYLRLRQTPEKRDFLIRAVVTLCLAGLFFALLFLLHGSTLAAPPVNASGHELASAGGTVFSAGLFPQGRYLVQQMLIAPYLATMIALAPLLWRQRPFEERVATVGLLLPLATVIFYRNSYPYFFVFLLAPAAVTIVPAVELVLRRFGIALCAVVLAMNAIILVAIEPKETIVTQRSISATVHRMFPKPVTYIDFCGFIGDFPRAYRFLTSGWGLERYRATGEPVLARLMEREPVPLLIDNHEVLDAAVNGRVHDEQLLSADAKTLRENFIPHWGPIWVAGKRIPTSKQPLMLIFAVPGIYTLEGAPLVIDGRRVQVGETVHLARGLHRIGPNENLPAILRWGDHLHIPNRPAPQPPFFTIY